MPLAVNNKEATGFIPQINQWVFALRFYNPNLSEGEMLNLYHHIIKVLDQKVNSN